jgi:hypothetical protein
MTVVKKDKAKVLDEVWTQERIRGFLDIQPPAGVDRDFHTLLKAYQQMRAEDFADFIAMFVADGRNLDACNNSGQTLQVIVEKHRHGAEFARILADAKA